MTETVTPPTMVVAVCGHRPPQVGGYKVPNPIYDSIVHGLIQAFEKYKPQYVFSGMALGVDQWAAEICVNMEIPLVAVIPFEGQDKMWPPHSQAKYQWLLQKAVQKIVVCAGSFEPWKMQKRNEWMINNCHQVVAVWTGAAGGTANCLAYATKVGKPIHYVPIQPQGILVGATPGPIQPAAEPKQEVPVTPKAKRIIDL